VLIYWKRYEKMEKEHRKKAEKEALEQKKHDDELRDVSLHFILACVHAGYSVFM